MKSRYVLWLFVAATVANLLAQVLDSEELNQYSKPLLMPLLLYYIYESSRGKVTKRILLLSLAVLLSWLGDLAMMYAHQEIFFLGGIGLFLLAHLCYIVVLKHSVFQPFGFSVVRILPFALFTLVLFYFLIPSAGEFAIPIFVYGIVISVMGGTARLREGSTSQESYQLALYGGILFMVSDSILAIDKFYTPIFLSGLWTMASYLGAQYLLIKGVLQHPE